MMILLPAKNWNRSISPMKKSMPNYFFTRVYRGNYEISF